ncbi:C10 family peptidase [bacterium]|nr:C10 family peptidase [bacterium]
MKNNFKFHLLIILMFAVSLNNVRAEKLAERDVREAVQTWVQNVTANARPDAVVESMEPYIVDSETLAYIAHLNDSGFCLCGADNLLYPVYYYNPHSDYDTDNPNYKYILDEISGRRNFYKTGIDTGDTLVLQYLEEFASREAIWRELSSGRIPPQRASSESPLSNPDSMSILFNCQWGQHSPFWHYCPTLTHNPLTPDTCVVGCVATATAQIMYYWEWPPNGTGIVNTDYIYKWNNVWLTQNLADDPGIDTTGGFRQRLQWVATGGGQLQMRGRWDSSLYGSAEAIDTSAAYLTALEALWNAMNVDTVHLEENLSSHSYNYGIMGDHPGSAASNLEMAKLSYHLGLAVNMDYGINGSAANTYDVPGVIIPRFDYDPDAHYIEVNKDSITTELLWSRPVQIRGSIPDGGGHSWVIFGYNKATDPNRQFRMNMGWDGGSDGWYTLDNVPLNLTEDQGHNVFVAPDSVVRFVGNSGTPGDGSPNNPHGDFDEGLTNVPEGGTLIMKANSVHNVDAAGDYVISKEVDLKGYNVEIRHGEP